MGKLVNRAKMCFNKVSFTNEKQAKRVAAKHGQIVYECPVCFCFHCTSKSQGVPKYIGLTAHKNIVADLEEKLKKQREKTKKYGRIILDLNTRIAELKKGE